MTTEVKKSLFGSFKKQINRIFNGSVIVWKIRNCPVPPPHKVKEKIIRNFAREHGCGALIETGTYRGDMIKAQINNFDWLASIELSEYYYERAQKRFSGKKKVHLYQGDSGEVIGQAIKDVPSGLKVCFWLDGHYSGGKTERKAKDTPIIQELDTVFDSLQSGVILIDDARCFIGQNDYPSIDELKKFVYEKNKAIELFDNRDDIIRIVF